MHLSNGFWTSYWQSWVPYKERSNEIGQMVQSVHSKITEKGGAFCSETHSYV